MSGPFDNDVSAYCFSRWGIEDAWPRLREDVLRECGAGPWAELTIRHPAFERVMERQWWFDNYCLVE